MIGADTHGSPIFFTDVYQRGKFLKDAVQFALIFQVGIFQLVKFLFIGVVTGVNAYLFNNTGGYLGGVWGKVYIGNQRYIVATLAQLFFYLGKVVW
jgi:hypothetical protein